MQAYFWCIVSHSAKFAKLGLTISKMSNRAFISNLNQHIYVCGQKQDMPHITTSNMNTPKQKTLSKIFMDEKFSDN
jgi:hypothetical protein